MEKTTDRYKRTGSEMEKTEAERRKDLNQSIRTFKSVTGNYPQSPLNIKGLLGFSNIGQVQSFIASAYAFMSFTEIVKKIQKEDTEN